jgi:hypothetical protein
MEGPLGVLFEVLRTVSEADRLSKSVDLQGPFWCFKLIEGTPGSPFASERRQRPIASKRIGGKSKAPRLLCAPAHGCAGRWVGWGGLVEWMVFGRGEDGFAGDGFER